MTSQCTELHGTLGSFLRLFLIIVGALLLFVAEIQSLRKQKYLRHPQNQRGKTFKPWVVLDGLWHPKGYGYQPLDSQSHPAP